MADADQLRRRALGRRLSRVLLDRGCSGRHVLGYLVGTVGLSEIDAAAIVWSELDAGPARRRSW